MQTSCFFVPTDSWAETAFQKAAIAAENSFFSSRAQALVHAVKAIAISILMTPIYVLKSLKDFSVLAINGKMCEALQKMSEDLKASMQSLIITILGAMIVAAGIVRPKIYQSIAPSRAESVASSSLETLSTRGQPSPFHTSDAISHESTHGSIANHPRIDLENSEHCATLYLDYDQNELPNDPIELRDNESPDHYLAFWQRRLEEQRQELANLPRLQEIRLATETQVASTALVQRRLTTTTAPRTPLRLIIHLVPDAVVDSTERKHQPLEPLAFTLWLPPVSTPTLRASLEITHPFIPKFGISVPSPRLIVRPDQLQYLIGLVAAYGRRNMSAEVEAVVQDIRHTLRMPPPRIIEERVSESDFEDFDLGDAAPDHTGPSWTAINELSLPYEFLELPSEFPTFVPCETESLSAYQNRSKILFENPRIIELLQKLEARVDLKPFVDELIMIGSLFSNQIVPGYVQGVTFYTAETLAPLHIIEALEKLAEGRFPCHPELLDAISQSQTMAQKRQLYALLALEPNAAAEILRSPLFQKSLRAPSSTLENMALGTSGHIPQRGLHNCIGSGFGLRFLFMSNSPITLAYFARNLMKFIEIARDHATEDVLDSQAFEGTLELTTREYIQEIIEHSQKKLKLLEDKIEELLERDSTIAEWNRATRDWDKVFQALEMVINPIRPTWLTRVLPGRLTPFWLSAIAACVGVYRDSRTASIKNLKEVGGLEQDILEQIPLGQKSREFSWTQLATVLKGKTSQAAEVILESYWNMVMTQGGTLLNYRLYRSRHLNFLRVHIDDRDNKCFVLFDPTEESPRVLSLEQMRSFVTTYDALIYQET